MGSSAAAIGRLHDELVAFANQPEQKLLVVEFEDNLRKDVLTQIEQLDLLLKDPAAVSIFESPWMAGDPCWDARHEELEDEWTALSKAFVREKHPALAPLPEAPNKDIVAFAKRLEFAANALAPHFQTLVVVLAPIAIEDPVQIANELSALLPQKPLAAIRWVVASVGTSGLQTLVTAGGKNAVMVQVAINEAAGTASMKAAVAAMKNAPVGAPEVQFAGGVGPRVAPPPRANAPTKAETTTAVTDALIAAKLSPGFADAVGMQQVRTLVMDAAMAAGDRDFAKAITAQRSARTITLNLGMPSETATLDLMLGSYALMAGQPKLGLEVFADVEQRAVAAGAGSLAVQAAMAKGGALSLLDRRLDAAAAYTEGGKHGAKLGVPSLAIESFSMGGQQLADLGDHRRALAVWQEALLTAEQAKPADVAGSSAVQVASKGAELNRKLGLFAEADAWTKRGNALAASFEAAAAAEAQA